jgi:hypothetical protein
MLILDMRRVTIEEVADKLHINHGSAYEIVHHRLSLCKVTARWVLKELTERMYTFGHLKLPFEPVS